MPKNTKVLEEAGAVPMTDENIKNLGVGSPNFYAFEFPEKLDRKKFVYRWTNWDNAPLMRTRKYVAVTLEECERIKPLHGEFKDSAWHLFDGSKSHMVLMRCPIEYFDQRRAYYGNIAKDNIQNDKEGLKAAGQREWRKGDSIAPDDVIVDSR
jgi:hypothetical protein